MIGVNFRNISRDECLIQFGPRDNKYASQVYNLFTNKTLKTFEGYDTLDLAIKAATDWVTGQS
jgi:hypothetical protein